MKHDNDHPTSPENLKKVQEAVKKLGIVPASSDGSAGETESKTKNSTLEMKVSGEELKEKLEKDQKHKKYVERKIKDEQRKKDRSITENEVRAKMRRCRGHPKDKLVHTYESAELELRRLGKKVITKTWLTVTHNHRRELALRSTNDHFFVSEWDAIKLMQVWPCPVYDAGVRDEIYIIPPDYEEAESWLPDEIFEEVASRPIQDRSEKMPAISVICNSLDIFPGWDDSEEASNGIGHNSVLYRRKKKLALLLRELGLFLDDSYYMDPKWTCASVGDEVVAERRVKYDTFASNRDAISDEDPRFIWLSIREGMKDGDIDLLREKVCHLALAAYWAGSAKAMAHFRDEYGDDVVKSKGFKKGRVKPGAKLKEHTQSFEDAARSYEDEYGEKATAAKVRDYIKESGNDIWLKHFKSVKFEAFRKAIGRYQSIYK